MLSSVFDSKGEPMKTMNVVETVWPMIRVEHANPEIRDEIITLKEAVKRFRLDERTEGHLHRGEIAGTSVNRSGSAGRDIRTIWRYTKQESIRDAADDLLKALEGIMDHDLIPRNSVCGRMALAAIKKATRD